MDGSRETQGTGAEPPGSAWTEIRSRWRRALVASFISLFLLLQVIILLGDRVSVTAKTALWAMGQLAVMTCSVGWIVACAHAPRPMGAADRERHLRAAFLRLGILSLLVSGIAASLLALTRGTRMMRWVAWVLLGVSVPFSVFALLRAFVANQRRKRLRATENHLGGQD